MNLEGSRNFFGINENQGKHNVITQTIPLKCCKAYNTIKMPKEEKEKAVSELEGKEKTPLQSC